jgi:hypothetical protein
MPTLRPYHVWLKSRPEQRFIIAALESILAGEPFEPNEEQRAIGLRILKKTHERMARRKRVE